MKNELPRSEITSLFGFSYVEENNIVYKDNYKLSVLGTNSE